eukprot:scpid20966/ scgid7707/ Probable ATP-dependent RNA helicase DDX46; DEAD box protein 46
MGRGRRPSSGSSDSDSDRDRRRKKRDDRGRDRDRRERSRSRDRVRRRSRSRDRERARDRDRDRRDGPRRDRDRERDRDRDRDRARRRRSRSRSPYRRRSPGRRRSRERSRSRERASRHASKSPEPSTGKRQSPAPPLVKTETKTTSSSTTTTPASTNNAPSASASSDPPPAKRTDSGNLGEEQQIDMVMERRKKVEAWRAAQRQAKDGTAETAEPVSEATVKEEPMKEEEESEPVVQKGWTLDDEDDDDEAEEENAGEEGESKKSEDDESTAVDMGTEGDDEEDDIDPLDAFMQGVQQEVRKIKGVDVDSEKKTSGKTATIVKTVVTTVQKSQPVVTKSTKGELMYNNQDALEYSSEGDSDAELKKNMAALKKKEKGSKKELAIVDHSKVTYSEFRKDFYVEVPELSRMTEEEVNAFREELGNVQVKGKNCPTPAKTWSQCGLSARVMDNIKKLKYDKPTPIQSQAIPAIMSGRDVIGIARTGSGKTVAFLLPLFRHVLDQEELETGDGAIAIIMTPTRELALQIYADCRKLGKGLNLTCACVYGGTGISEQISELKRGAEVIICTPGRMIDMLAANNGRVTNLRRVTYLVLDEADRMFDMGFEPQVMKIIDNTRPDRQTVMFSATFPRQMEALARRILKRPVEVQVGGRSVVCVDIVQTIMMMEEEDKYFKLLELLGQYQEMGSVLVFVEKQEDADRLLKELFKSGYPCMSLHGGMDQSDRDSVISDFKQGVTRLLIATSVAARGLDVKQLILVLNYACPNHYEDYVHRVGRTGRAGNKGYAITFITSEQGRYAGDIIKALELSVTPVPEELTQLWDDYVEEQKCMGRDVIKMRNKGFKGKGFKFDESEKAQAQEQRAHQKAALGLRDSDEEEAAAGKAADDLEEQIEKWFSSRPRPKESRHQKNNVNKSSLLPSNAQAGGASSTAPQTEALRRAQAIAGNIITDRGLGAQLGAGGSSSGLDTIGQVMRGDAVRSVSGVALAAQRAVQISKERGLATTQNTSGVSASTAMTTDKVEEEKKTEEQVNYEDEVEINDMPQQVRWKVTSRDSMDSITEYSECAVTVRGVHFPPGKEPKEDERKLHLYVEGPNERAVMIAKMEIKRIIKEEIRRQASTLAYQRQPQSSGRYQVL